MDTKELEAEFDKLDSEYKQLEERRKKLMRQLLEKSPSLNVYPRDNGVKIVTWKTGSWEATYNMLDAHYKGVIDITKYWKIGDTRRVKLNNGEFIDLVLVGKNHDNLVKNINDITKAVFTVQTKHCLNAGRQMFSDWHTPQYSLWSDSDMREFLNDKFKKALPKEMQSLIKTVKKETYRYAYNNGDNKYDWFRGTAITEDDIFLLSEMETYGTQSLGKEYNWGRGNDGIQYEYYKIASNRIKFSGADNGSDNRWWLRSSIVGNNRNSLFRIVNEGGYVDYEFASSICGLAPAFCI